MRKVRDCVDQTIGGQIAFHNEVTQHAGTFGLVERVAIGEHLDGLDGVAGELDVERLLHLLRHLTKRCFGDCRLDDIPHLQEEGLVIRVQRIVLEEGDRLPFRLQNAADMRLAQRMV